MKLARLRPLYEHGGPYASAYLPASRHSADSAKAIALHWRHARIELGRQGADDPTLDEIEKLVTDRDNAAPGWAVFAAGGKVVYAQELPEPPRQSVRYGPLPDVLPMLEQCPEQVPTVQVKADRQGADIIVTNGREHRATAVEGETWPIRKVKTGGWSQSHIQRNAEETWEQNARTVAAEVVREARAVDAELILVGGDVRARELVLESLPEPYVRRAVPAESGARQANGNGEAAWEEQVATALREYDREHHDALIARFREAHGRGDAVTGMSAVVEALRGGQVETLLLAPPVRGELCYGDQAYELAVGELELREFGVRDPRCEAAGPVLARAAVATDADLEFTADLTLPDGVGALLRFTA